jgi:hypothetical protein
MKLKKLFAGVVAAAMIATMSFPAFADSVNIGGNVRVGQAAPGETLTIAKTYTVNAGSFNSDNVNLELVAFEANDYVRVTDSSITDEAAEQLRPTFTANSNATKDDASITMTLPRYEKVGIYTYQVKEDDGGTLGMTYDDTTYTLQVRVANKMLDGKIDPSGDKVCYVTMKADSTKESSVKNTYNSSNLTISKNVEGNMGDRSNGTKFNFKVTLTVPDGKTLNSTITGTNNADVVWNEGKTVGTVTFQLSHGESFTLMNLPYDIEYTVDEMNGTTTVLNQGDKINDTYQVSYDNHKAGTIGTGEGKIAPTEGVISTTVTNTWGAEIDTGVILDNAPYILMLAVVAGAAMTLVIKKRREEE